MQQLFAVWQTLDNSRRVIVVLATVAVIATVMTLANLATRPSLALLYAGLDGSRAGDVIAALDQRGAVYEVRGDAIYTDAARRDELRMMLAAEGLPANSGTGYELLDSLSGFGTTSQMFDAAYLRAKEGELARTISALPTIRSARVHIADTRAQGLRAQARPTASVTVATTGGISPSHAKALKFLVASAVSGMSPDDVSVIDGNGALVLAGDESTTGEDRAETLRRNVERLLEARVGYGNAVVEVSIDTVTEREAITERRFDPDSRVAISTDTVESENSSSDSDASAVTVASNLPSGDAGNTGGNSQSQKSETRERTNFEVSETTREVLRTPGAIRRVTVAVLVDGVVSTDAVGVTTRTPRPEPELAALRELVAAAVGFEEARGDVITLKSMEFEPLAIPETGTGAGVSMLSALGIDVMGLARLAALALVSLILGLFVLRPILTSRGARAPELPAPTPRRAARPDPQALTGEIDDGDFMPANLAIVSDTGLGSGRGSVPSGHGAPDPEDPVARLRQLISDRQEETVEILRGWMETTEEEKA